MKSAAGFTLIELLVALTITSLLLTAVYQSVLSVRVASEQAAAGNATHHQARLLADRLGRELLSLQVRSADAGTWLVVDGRSAQSELTFTSSASSPLAGLPGVPSRIVYTLRPATTDELGPYVLQRSEGSVLSLDTPRPLRFLDGVRQLRWQFLVDGSWRDDFKATPGRLLPDAVSVQLETGDGNLFRTAFTVAAAGG
jgi:general secretion pathway protein J